jgi:hypothetical protein
MKHQKIEHIGAPIRFSRQRGASLLEGIAYLGVAAIVVLGAISLLDNAFDNAQSNRAVEEITALRTAVRKLYAGQQYPAAALTADIIAAGAVPGTLRVNGNAITNAWNGAVTVTGVTANTFTISIGALPVDACVNVVSGATGWTRISVNAAAANDITVFPATVARATTACNAAANNLVFTAT